MVAVGAFGEKFEVNIQYEKLPTFCFFCGLIGHDERGCTLKLKREIAAPNNLLNIEISTEGRDKDPNLNEIKPSDKSPILHGTEMKDTSLTLHRTETSHGDPYVLRDCNIPLSNEAPDKDFSQTAEDRATKRYSKRVSNLLEAESPIQMVGSLDYPT
ncbi:hypothetical protein O6P43_026843 [Quillaja saponaria]|uniref:Zinc knuckle CX2CX4HX4C domain-containing protein n=1 Tax=Quillaja saponaria TaxID=32244 RepID=A0AAD7PCM3_QUISA|nr:hypothetical protein O6P43_026843 [Quillaja saponaria]